MTHWREKSPPPFFPTPYDTRSQLTIGRVISPHPDNVEIGYF